MTNLSVVRPLISFGYKSAMKKVATDIQAPCAYGGERLSIINKATAEHVKPRSLGGPSNDFNYLPVCKLHNGERGNTPLDIYLKSHPQAWENIKRSILALRDVVTENFNGKIWAQNIQKVVETEAKRPLNLNIGETQVKRPIANLNAEDTQVKKQIGIKILKSKIRIPGINTSETNRSSGLRVTA
jgi:hypothetical protein